MISKTELRMSCLHASEGNFSGQLSRRSRQSAEWRLRERSDFARKKGLPWHFRQIPLDVSVQKSSSSDGVAKPWVPLNHELALVREPVLALVVDSEGSNDQDKMRLKRDCACFGQRIRRSARLCALL